MAAIPSTYQIGNFVLNYDGWRMQSATYRGRDLNSETWRLVDEAFRTGNRVQFEAFSNKVFDTVADLDKNHSKFDLSIALTNAYFERINGYFNEYFSQGLVPYGQAILKLAIDTVRKWEDKNGYRIHKGTPYTFLGYTHLITGNLDLGFSLVHDSLAQNRLTYPRLKEDYKKSPSYSFATLNKDNTNSMLIDYVIRMKAKVESIIDKHNVACGTSIAHFSYPTFHNKFLQRESLEPIVFYFVNTVMTTLNLENWDKNLLSNNAFFHLKKIGLLFNVSLVVDKVLSEKYGSEYVKEGVFGYLKEVEKITDTNVHALNTCFNYSNGNPITISSENIENLVPALLNNTISYRGQKTTYRMRAMLAAWNVRNFSAHNLTGIEDLLKTTPYEKIFNLLMSALFFATEVLP